MQSQPIFMKDIIPDEYKEVLMDMANKAVTIPEGEKIGRWTRTDRVAVVYSALCSLLRISMQKELSK
jgi:hypothetical protein